MCLLLETIKIVDGQVQNLPYHITRMNNSVQALFRGGYNFSTLEIKVPVNCRSGVFKCRILYAPEIKEIQFLPYQKRSIKKIVFIKDDEIEYPFKYADRTCFTQYTDKLKQDEEIIIIKKSFITDSSFSNIALWDGHQWVTPATPLLNGTKRQQLLNAHFMVEKTLSLQDFYSCEKISLINAMNDLGDLEIQINKADENF